MTEHYKRVFLVGIAAYVTMIFLAALYYKERVIFVDTSYTIFYLIKDGFFRIESYRFGDALSQVLPLLCIKAGLPLGNILLSYSLSFMIYYFMCYVMCGFVFGRYDMAMVILLLNTLFVSETFYWIPSEVPQGMALLTVVLAYISSREAVGIKVAGWSFIVACLVVAAFFHPLLSGVLLYAVAFFSMGQHRIAPRRVLYVITGIFFSLLLIKAVFFRSAYEQHSLSGLKNFVTQFPDYFTLYSNKRFLSNSLTKYYWIPVVLVAVSVVYFRNKDWRKLGFFLCAFFGYLFLVNISYPTPVTPQFYIENLYLPLSFILALPFVFDVMPVLQAKKLALPVAVLMVLTACIRINMAHSTYTDRLSYERAYLDKYDSQKVIIKATPTDMDTLQLVWSSAYELLLLSALERGKPASIRIDDHPETLRDVDQMKSNLLLYGDLVPYSAIPEKYFHFTDTVTAYKLVLSR